MSHMEFRNAESFNRINSPKIGNLLNYLATKIDNLFVTKSLKLIYLIDETAVKETGVPVTFLNYNVWKKGPVPPVIHSNLTFENASLFDEFIEIKEVKTENWTGQRILPKVSFSEDEFSEYEMNLFDRIIDKFGSRNSKELIGLLHKENTLWHKIVLEKGLQPKFDNVKDANTSTYSIVLSDAIASDPFKVQMYKEAEENNRIFNCFEA